MLLEIPVAHGGTRDNISVGTKVPTFEDITCRNIYTESGDRLNSNGVCWGGGGGGGEVERYQERGMKTEVKVTALEHQGLRGEWKGMEAMCTI